MAREMDEAWVEEAIARYRRIEQLQSTFDQALDGVEVTVHSPDGLVEVLVTGSGRIRDVVIVGSLGGRTSADVSRSIQAAVTAAHDAARWAREKLRADMFSDYPPLGEGSA